MVERKYERRERSSPYILSPPLTAKTRRQPLLVVHVTTPHHSTHAQRVFLPRAKLYHEPLSKLSKLSAGLPRRKKCKLNGSKFHSQQYCTVSTPATTMTRPSEHLGSSQSRASGALFCCIVSKSNCSSLNQERTKILAQFYSCLPKSFCTHDHVSSAINPVSCVKNRRAGTATNSKHSRKSPIGRPQE